MRTLIAGSAMTSALFIAFLTSAQAQVSTSVSVSGDVKTPTVFTLPGLQALPQTTQTDTYTSNGNPVTATYTGPTLWNVIQASGEIATNPAVKNDSLNKYVIATGADGYKSIVSVGEIS